MILLTVREVAAQLGLAPSSVRSTLSRQRALFEPRYGRRGSHPRRWRILTEGDFKVLAWLASSAALRRRGG